MQSQILREYFYEITVLKKNYYNIFNFNQNIKKKISTP